MSSVLQTDRYLGESAEGHRPTHRIAFRGIRRFDTGTDVREWEGIAIVDADLLHSLAGDPPQEGHPVMKLPNKIVWQEFRMNGSGNFFEKRTEERRYLDYRFFEVEAGELDR